MAPRNRTNGSSRKIASVDLAKACGGEEQDFDWLGYCARQAAIGQMSPLCYQRLEQGRAVKEPTGDADPGTRSRGAENRLLGG